MIVKLNTEQKLDMKSLLANDLIVSDSEFGTSHYIENDVCKCAFCEKEIQVTINKGKCKMLCDCDKAKEEHEALVFLNITRKSFLKNSIEPKLLKAKKAMFLEIAKYATACSKMIDTIAKERIPKNDTTE